MKKILRIISLVIAVSCFCVIFAACSYQPESKQLQAPSGGEFTDTMFIWDGEPNAEEYIVEINGEEHITHDTEYEMTYSEYTEYKIRIKALGDGERFTDSDWSDYCEIHVPEVELETVDRDTAYKIKKVSRGADGDCILPRFFNGKPLTAIGNRAFYGCTTLTSLIIPDNITDIDVGAFEGCTSLNNIKLPKLLNKIKSNVFNGCLQLSEVEIPDGVTSVSPSAFIDSGIEKIYIPDKVTNILSISFSRCAKLKDITVSPDNKIYRSEGNCIIRKADGVLVSGCTYSVIPDGVSEIADGSLSYCDFQYMVIPESVRIIGEWAFNKCDKLKKVEFNGEQDIEIRERAYLNCTELSEITLPDGLSCIKEFAFDGCSALKSFVLPAGVREFYGNSLDNCSGIEHLAVSEKNSIYAEVGDCIIRKSDNVLIRGCKNSVVPDTVKEIGDYAFSGAGLTELTIGKNVEVIGDSAYSLCRFDEIILPYGVTTIKSRAFCPCFATRIAIPTSVKYIGNSAFLRHSKAPACAVAVSETVETIGSSGIGGSTVFFVERKEGWEYTKTPLGQFITWYASNVPIANCEIGYENGYAYVAKFEFHVREVRDSDGYIEGANHKRAEPPFGSPFRVGYEFTGYALEPDGTPLTDDEFDAYLNENLECRITLYPIYEQQTEISSSTE